MKSSRFHLVIANHQRIRSFVENFPRINGFNARADRVYVFDCSPEDTWRSEMARLHDLCRYGLKWNENLFFVRRRNWGVNHGAQLDYFRAILEGLIRPPQYSAFMQEHFLDLENLVKEDTIPESCTYDLNEIAGKFESDPQAGCIFHARHGMRISVSNPVSQRTGEFFGDRDTLLEGSVLRGFLVDGGNFIVRPGPYLDWFGIHPRSLTAGDGSYGFSHVWEARLGQILYDRKIKWCDLSRNLDYSTIAEVQALEQRLSERISKLWYDNRVWYFYYGRDQWRYPPRPLRSILRYFPVFVTQHVAHARNAELTFVQPKDFPRL